MEWEPQRRVSKRGISGALAALLASVSSLYLLQDSEPAPDKGDDGVSDPESDSLLSLDLDPAPKPETQPERNEPDVAPQRAPETSLHNARKIDAHAKPGTNTADTVVGVPAADTVSTVPTLPTARIEPSFRRTDASPVQGDAPAAAPVQVMPQAPAAVAGSTVTTLPDRPSAVSIPTIKPPPVQAPLSPVQSSTSSTGAPVQTATPRSSTVDDGVNGSRSRPLTTEAATTSSPSFPSPAKLPASAVRLADMKPALDALATDGSAGGAPDPVPSEAALPTHIDGALPGESLALAAIVNDTPADRVMTVTRTPAGDFSVRADDLRSMRIKVDPQIADDTSVPLSSLPGVSARYIEPSQSLALNVPDDLLFPTVLDVSRRKTVDLSKVDRGPGLLFNYRVFGSAESGNGPGKQIAGDVELVALTPPGIIVSEGFFSSRGRRGFVRGNTFFRHEDPLAVRSYTVGDLVTGSVNWSRSVRLGGLQIQSDFNQRPDLFTGPLPQFAGSAAVPSSVEIYAAGLKIFNANVPQGPFILRSIPSITGNELRIVTTDRNGRQTEITAPYFNAPGLLRKGIVEYSAELGVPRTGIGVRSFGYRDTVFGSATARYGLSDITTVEGHVEAGGDLINGGFGVIQALGRLGSITASAVGSRFRDVEGARLEAQYRFDKRNFSLFATVEREFGNYIDLGDVSAFRLQPNGPQGTGTVPIAQRRSVERVGASFRPDFDPTSLNLTYSHLRFGDSESRALDFGIRRRINDRLSFRGNAIVDLERKGNLAVSLGLNVRLGRNTTGFVGADRANGRTSYNVSATGFSGGRQNVLGYSLAQRGNDDGDAFRSASLNYRFPETFVAGTIEQSGKDVRGTVQVEGSIVAAGGGVFLANRVGDAFAIVRNAGPGVDILQGGRKVARADRNGRALLASLEPFSETKVSIDPTSLGPDLEAEKGTDQTVVTERRRAALIDFGVRKVNAAIVVIFGADSRPLPVGTEIQLEGGTPGVMGYDGEVFLKDLKATNRITIDLGSGKRCTASFPYETSGAPQPRIGPIICS